MTEKAGEKKSENETIKLAEWEIVILANVSMAKFLTALWDSILVYIRPSPREEERKKTDERKKCPNNPYPHLLLAQQALALQLSKLVGRCGTESLPSTFVPSDHPHDKMKL